MIRSPHQPGRARLLLVAGALVAFTVPYAIVSAIGAHRNRQWAQSGLSAYEIGEWRDHGFTAPADALRWRNGGFKAPGARIWREAGWSDPAEAARWRDRGYTAEEAAARRARGESPRSGGES